MVYTNSVAETYPEERQPEQPEFEAIAQGPLWNTTLSLLLGTLEEDLIGILKEFQRVAGEPIMGYLYYEEDGHPYFHLTRYPESRPGYPPPPDDAACNRAADALAAWLSTKHRPVRPQTPPLMALICLKEGYEEDGLTHESDFARSLFSPGTDLVDAHKFSLRFKQDDKGELVAYCNPEPGIIVRGTRAIMPQVINAAYALGQHHVPMEDSQAKTITLFQTALAH